MSALLKIYQIQDNDIFIGFQKISTLLNLSSHVHSFRCPPKVRQSVWRDLRLLDILSSTLSTINHEPETRDRSFTPTYGFSNTQNNLFVDLYIDERPLYFTGPRKTLNTLRRR